MTSGAGVPGGVIPAWTVRASVVVCVREPEVPAKATELLEATVPEAAVNVMVCAVPGVRLSDVGFAVTPEGRPVREMATFPVKAFRALAVTLTA